MTVRHRTGEVFLLLTEIRGLVLVLTAADGRNSNACDVTGLCCGLGEPRGGLGECSGDTGPPGAKDDANAFFEGDSGDGWPPRDPEGI